MTGCHQNRYHQMYNGLNNPIVKLLFFLSIFSYFDKNVMKSEVYFFSTVTEKWLLKTHFSE